MLIREPPSIEKRKQCFSQTSLHTIGCTHRKNKGKEKEKEIRIKYDLIRSSKVNQPEKFIF